MIYFIQGEQTLLIKIGYTGGDPLDRLGALQTGSAERLTLLATMPGDQSLERDLHFRFAAFRVAGEWFRPAPALLQYILGALEQPPEPDLSIPLPSVPAWPLTIYLAGKIAKGDWRSGIVDVNDPCGDDGQCPGGGPEPLPLHWPVLEKAVFGVHHYAGPFFRSCDHGCWHGASKHGLGAVDDSWMGHGPGLERRAIHLLCLDAIRRSNVVFAWIDRPDCYGSIAEIGYAASLGLVIWIAGPERLRDLWFVYEHADHTAFGNRRGRGPHEVLKQLLADPAFYRNHLEARAAR